MGRGYERFVANGGASDPNLKFVYYIRMRRNEFQVQKGRYKVLNLVRLLDLEFGIIQGRK